MDDATLETERNLYTLPTISALAQRVDFETAAGSVDNVDVVWAPRMVSEGEYFNYWLAADTPRNSIA